LTRRPERVCCFEPTLPLGNEPVTKKHRKILDKKSKNYQKVQSPDPFLQLLWKNILEKEPKKK
jgi:hypothetical protein